MRCLKEIWDVRDVEDRAMNGLVKQASSIRKVFIGVREQGNRRSGKWKRKGSYRKW